MLVGGANRRDLRRSRLPPDWVLRRGLYCSLDRSCRRPDFRGEYLDQTMISDGVAT